MTTSMNDSRRVGTVGYGEELRRRSWVMPLIAIATAMAMLAFVPVTPASAATGFFTTIDGPNATTTSVQALNANGDSGGVYGDAAGTHGFIRTSDGTFTTVDGPNSNSTLLEALNDNGDAAGTYNNAAGVHGFIRAADGTITTVDVPDATTTRLQALNNNGDSAGVYSDLTRTSGFVRTAAGIITTFDPPGSTFTDVKDLNHSGDTAGIYIDGTGQHGFVRIADSTITTIDGPNATRTLVNALNNNGDTAGSYDDANGTHGFIRTAAGIITTVDVTDALETVVSALNDNGDSAGAYLDGTGTLHGFVRTADGTITTVDPTGSTFTNVTALNNSGVAGGLYADIAGTHGFIYTPTDDTPPAVTFPTPNVFIDRTSPQTVGGTVTDSVSGVDRVEIIALDLGASGASGVPADQLTVWNGTAWQTAPDAITLQATVDNGNWSFEWNPIPGGSGSYVIGVRAFDRAGNKWPADKPWQALVVIADTSRPVIAANAAIVQDDTITWTGFAGDDVAVRKVRMIIRHVDTNEYWNGTAWIPAAQTGTTPSILLHADLSAPLSSNPNWSYSLTTPRTGTFQTLHWAQNGAFRYSIAAPGQINK